MGRSFCFIVPLNRSADDRVGEHGGPFSALAQRWKGKLETLHWLRGVKVSDVII